MKSKNLSFSRCRIAAQGLLLGFVLLAPGSASAQNFVKNPDFEEPLGPDNWTIEYTAVTGGGANQPTNCGPWDFLVAGRTTMANRDRIPGIWDTNNFGGHFAPNHTWMMHAYFKQIVSGLQPGSNYACSAWMAQMTKNDAYLSKQNVYMEALGGPNRTLAKRTVDVVDNVHNNPAGWKRYTVTNTASSSGEIEIRLHCNKFGNIAQTWEYRNLNAYYDHVSVMLPGQTPPVPTPLSVTIADQTATFTWDTAQNQPYRIEISPDLSTWTTFVDNLVATGTSLTLTTNLYMSVNNPQYFRAVTEYYDP